MGEASTPAAGIPTTAGQNALERVAAALAASPHQRGSNWQPIAVELYDEASGETVRKQGFRNPCIALFSDDIAALCDAVPADKKTQIVKDLRRGQRPHLRRKPPVEVHIHVDDAHHLYELAAAAAAAPAMPAAKS